MEQRRCSILNDTNEYKIKQQEHFFFFKKRQSFAYIFITASIFIVYEKQVFPEYFKRLVYIYVKIFLKIQSFAHIFFTSSVFIIYEKKYFLDFLKVHIYVKVPRMFSACRSRLAPAPDELARPGRRLE